MRQTLRTFDGQPAGLAALQARELAAALGGPALIRIPGRQEPPLLVSVLLHGNETSGWDGVRRLLSEAAPLPRSLVLFIGNVHAAAAGVRTLPGQQDYNRIWQGADGAEGALAAAVLEALGAGEVFASLDLHNNTGHNPHYAVLTHLTPDNLALAYLFDDKAVYVREPATVMTRALVSRGPAAALELGPIGDPRCDDRAFDIVKRCLALTRIPPADAGQMQLFRSEARVHVTEDTPFSFVGDGIATPLLLTGGLEAVNFHELATGTEFARSAGGLSTLRVLDVQHRDVTADYFAADGDRITLRAPVIPAMYTTDPAVVRQDCLCYFMERMSPLPPGSAHTE
ncbi:MAG: succinylglutamate desuccinylase/aspartoacylase family protein [Pseudomonadales bacterium]